MTVSYSALSPVSAGIYAGLNVSSVTSVAIGGVCDDVAQRTAFPFLLFVVSEEAAGGFGTRPGRGQLPQMNLRLHAFSEYEGGKQAQSVINVALGALFAAFDPDAPTVTLTGYRVCSLFHDRSSEPFDSDIGGIKVKEVVADLRMFVELQ